MEENTNLEAVKEHFANLGEKLDRIIDHVGYRQLPDYVEDITLTNQYQGPVKLRGYRYLYMLVSADAITAMGSSNLMTLDIGGGVTYLQQLKPGWNVIDAPREFRYRVVGLSGNPPALLVHTNDLKAMDGVVSYSGGGVGGSAGNPSYTELTGSLAPLPSPGEILLIGPNAGVSVAAGTTYITPSVNLLGQRGLVGFMDVSGLSGTTVVMSVSILMKTSLLKNSQFYTYASSNSIAYNAVLYNGGGGSSRIFTKDTCMSFAAPSTNTAAFTINGASLGVA